MAAARGAACGKAQQHHNRQHKQAQCNMPPHKIHLGRPFMREAVAGTAHGLHKAVEAAGLQRTAQAADVHIYRALFHKHMIAPHQIQQLAAAV